MWFLLFFPSVRTGGIFQIFSDCKKSKQKSALLAFQYCIDNPVHNACDECAICLKKFKDADELKKCNLIDFC